MAPESERANCKHERLNMDGACPCGYWVGDPTAHLREPTLTCSDCGHPKDDSRYHLDAPGTNWGAALHAFVPPTSLTCSKVVERLAKIVMDEPINYPDKGDGGGVLHPHTVRSNIAAKLRTQAPAILHSWRERRVQELEAAIRNFGYWLDEDQVSMWCKVCDAGKGTQHARIYGVDTKDWGPCPVGQAEESEQIRKGAKHE